MLCRIAYASWDSFGDLGSASANVPVEKIEERRCVGELRSHLGTSSASWADLGRSWADLGRSWPGLARLGADLGPILGDLGRLKAL